MYVNIHFFIGPRYAIATGESLLDGYLKLGKPILITYFVLNLATMFTIQTAVTIVTAGLAANLFGNYIKSCYMEYPDYSDLFTDFAYRPIQAIRYTDENYYYHSNH